MNGAVPANRDARPHRRFRSTVRAGFVWSLPPAAFNAILLVVASAAGLDFTVWPDPDSQDPVMLTTLIVIAATVFAGLVAGILAALLARYVKKAVRWVIVIGVLGTIASFAAPLGQPDQVSDTVRVVLVCMHAVAGICITGGIARGLATEDRAGRI